MAQNFRDCVAAEAVKQREYRQAGKTIPPEMKRYARLSGGILALTGVGATLLSWGLLWGSGSLYVFFLLLGLTAGIAGVLQLVTGKHLLTRR